MKILHVIANLAPRYGGPPKACFEMARAVASLGHSVSIYATNQDGPTEIQVPIGLPIKKNDIEIRYFPVQNPRFWSYSFPLARELRKVVKNFDIVHIHSLYLFHSMVTGYYCRKYNVPYLIRPHGTLDPLIYKRHRFRKSIMELFFEYKNFQCAHAIHFTTEKEMKNALTLKLISQPNSGIVVPLGLELSEYKNLPKRGTFRSKFPEIKGKKIILFFGRINFIKGLDILIHAFIKVANLKSDVHLVIAGPDNEGLGNKIKKWFIDNKIFNRVTFTGLLQGKDKLSALRDAYMFVLPSYSESFGISVIEAMACGLPVIISDRVNICGAVSKKGAGKVIPCDENILAKSILGLLDDKELSKQMGLKGKALVKEHFQWSKIALKLEDVYRTIITNKYLQDYQNNGSRVS